MHDPKVFGKETMPRVAPWQSAQDFNHPGLSGGQFLNVNGSRIITSAKLGG